MRELCQLRELRAVCHRIDGDLHAVTSSTSEMFRVGSTFLQLKLVLNKGVTKENVSMGTHSSAPLMACFETLQGGTVMLIPVLQSSRCRSSTSSFTRWRRPRLPSTSSAELVRAIAIRFSLNADHAGGVLCNAWYQHQSSLLHARAKPSHPFTVLVRCKNKVDHETKRKRNTKRNTKRKM